MKFSEEELLQVVAKRVRKYTSNESTSVTYQTARQILSSVLYCIQEVDFDVSHATAYEESYELSEGNNNLTAMKAFEIGLNKKKDKIKRAKKLFASLCVRFEDYHNDCYRETIIDGMKAFFERYDVDFDATNHLLTLDYPLICEVKNIQGIDLIYEYLYRTSLEQEFLGYFSKEEVEKILIAYHRDYSGLIINIASIVLRNSLGRLLTKQDLNCLSIGEMQRIEIEELFQDKEQDKIRQILNDTLQSFVMEQFKGDICLFEYLKKDINEIAYVLMLGIKQHSLQQVLIEVKDPKSIQEKKYREGGSMEDEALRELIEVMKKQSLEARIELIKKRVKSLSDLKELLQECFYQEECNRVFALLSDEERNVLIEEIKQKLDFDEALYEWEERLIYKI